MLHTENPTLRDAGTRSILPSPIVGWQTGSTSESVELRISVESACFLSMVTGEQGFLLAPEQARQIIRGLSAAVLASDVKRSAEVTNGQRLSRHEPSEV
jgi:hypothetical protein